MPSCIYFGRFYRTHTQFFFYWIQAEMVKLYGKRSIPEHFMGKKIHLKRNFPTIHLLSCTSKLRKRASERERLKEKDREKAEEKCLTFTSRTITTELCTRILVVFWCCCSNGMVLLSLEFVPLLILSLLFLLFSLPFSDYLLLTECDCNSPKSRSLSLALASSLWHCDCGAWRLSERMNEAKYVQYSSAL